MAKKITEEMLGEIHVSGAEQEVMDEVDYRTLFIGLGGTGGHVLRDLRRKMTDEEASKARMLYLDTDSRDVNTLRSMGVPAINISSSDTVRDIVNYLGDDDGVLDWIAADGNDSAFLSSKTDEGASQYRSKSRLCLAKLLKRNGNELERVLDEISTPGAGLNKEMLRVMIVSSVAGGTGAGTFIQVALYLREYFRSHGHKDICIMGLLACPDLFVRTCSESNKDNMYANAYAAVRELNAMNLVVANDATQEGYGKSINISINTKSEGLLFDSKHPLFASSGNTSYKPFDLLYFVDIANAEGGVLRTIEQYYGVMADVVHTRLYSPMEGIIRSDESNELSKHANYPTAIYGSAGYGRIRYPYHGLVTYLAVRKTNEELDYTWSQMENDWLRYKREKQMMAKTTGKIWSPSSEERGKRYISDMGTYMDENSRSTMRLLKGMVWDDQLDMDRAEIYQQYIEEQVSSATGFEASTEDLDMLYCLGKDEAVSKERERLIAEYQRFAKKLAEHNANRSKRNAGAILEDLTALAASAEANLKNYISALNAHIPGRAQLVASAIAPRTLVDAQIAQKEENPMNLYHGLLCMGGTAVHPLAARYLLYRLRDLLEKVMGENKEDLYRYYKGLQLTFDTDLGDNIDVTAATHAQTLSKKSFWTREQEARMAMEEYLKKYKWAIEKTMKAATDSLLREVYSRVKVVVDQLIEQYEGLFDNLEQYKVSLSNLLKREQDAHERSSDDRCIFINASREAKEYYYSGDLRTREVLAQGNGQIAAAAGQGIYEALIARTCKELEKQDAELLTDGAASMFDREEEDTYSDMGYVFENIIKLYRDYLFEKAEHLDVGIITAMIRESCRRVGLTEADLANDIKRGRIRHAFDGIVADVISKAQPMLNFDANNTDPYFEKEKEDKATNVATSYLHIGVSRKAAKNLTEIYQADNLDDAVAQFKTQHHLSRELSVNSNYSDYELVCFRAVHCLQPTQIRKFREGYTRGYYSSYKARLCNLNSSGRLSNTPHLDKRWHLREAMPYISRSMEIEWYKKTAKAFIYETLSRNLCFTEDSDSVTCFSHSPEGQSRSFMVNWPARQLVTVKDISRLMEYLQEHDDRVEEANRLLDEQIQELVEYCAEYTDSLPVYKAALTTNPLLKKLRGNLMVRREHISMATAARGKNAARRKTPNEAELEALQKACAVMGIDDDLAEAKQTLGGLLEIAYLVHKSEEKQKRDHDYGEYIVAAAMEIVEKLCAAMCGEQVPEDSEDYAMYQDLYNSVAEKFMEAMVVSLLRKLKMFDEETLKDAETVKYYRYLDIPVVITQTAEYKWAAPLLKLK